MQEEIILVDENDNEIGAGEKLEVHQKGLLHRAFSIFIFNSNNELMLQKRASHKYHSGGLWTNTCCSHPHPGESILEAAHARLRAEMGFDTELQEKLVFQYKTQFEDLSENEVDHVLVGNHNENPSPNPKEAEDWKWMSLPEIKNDIANRPEAYTSWFKIAVEKF